MTKAATLIVAILAMLASGCRSSSAVYDGFENPALSKYWESRKLLPGAFQIQSAVVRDGKRAAIITLKPGDQIPQEKGTKLERAELLESKWLWSVEDTACAYSFSLFLPPDHPVSSTRLVIAQWKQYCPADQCKPDNPVLAIRYQDGELLIAKQVTEEKETLFRTKEEIRNRWMDFKFQIYFSRSDRGRIKAWLGDRMIINHTGINAYPQTGGYPARGLFLFKTGLYRDQMSEPMTIYIDEYRKEPLPDTLP